jgi:CBS domain-containing protein
MVLVAKDIMDPDVLTIDEATDALTCAKTMTSRHKGYAVLTRAGAVAGIVTEWDFLSKVVAAARDPATVPVQEISTKVVDACAPETPTDVVVATMAEKGIRRMIVLADRRVVGVITSRNVLSTFRAYVDKLSAEIAAYQSPGTMLG